MPNSVRYLGVPLLAAALVVGGCASGGPAIERLPVDALVERGMQDFERRRWSDAIRAFERVVLEYPTHPRIEEIRFRLGEAYMGRREYVTAASELTRLATDYPASAYADDARFRVCESYYELSPNVQLDQEYTRAAIDHCESLVAYYPSSEYVARAQEIVAELRERLAEKVLVGGEFYAKRRAFDSAIVYFEEVVRDYPRSAAAPKALLRLVQVYQQLGYADEAEEAKQRLLREYPGTAEAREAEGISLANGP